MPPPFLPESALTLLWLTAYYPHFGEVFCSVGRNHKMTLVLLKLIARYQMYPYKVVHYKIIQFVGVSCTGSIRSSVKERGKRTSLGKNLFQNHFSLFLSQNSPHGILQFTGEQTISGRQRAKNETYLVNGQVGRVTSISHVNSAAQSANKIQ